MADSFGVIVAKPRSDNDTFLVWAPQYYRVFQQDNDVPFIEKEVTVLGENSMLSLLQAIGKKAKKRIIIVSHANPDGLAIPIGRDRERFAWIRMTLLLHAAVIREAYLKAKRQELEGKANDPTIWYEVYALTHPSHRFAFGTEKDGQAAALQGLQGEVQSDALDSFMESIANFAKQLKNAKSEQDKQAAVKQCKEKIDRVRSEIQKAMEWLSGELAMTDSEIDEHVKALKAVHSLDLERVEIRGCNLGKSPDAMKVLCVFLGASKLRAPDVQDSFGSILPNVSAQAKGFSARKRKQGGDEAITTTGVKRIPSPNGKGMTKQSGWRFEVRDLKADKDELYFSFSFGKDKNGTYMVAESIDVVEQFVKTHMGELRKGEAVKSGKIVPGQWLATPLPTFPRDQEFEKHLQAVEREFKPNLSTRRITALSKK